jgi:hypothetical protein
MSDRQYLINLTNNLISKNGYDRLRLGSVGLRHYIVQDLTCGGDVFRMSPAKLGEIMAAFDIGDVLATKQEIFELVRFSGHCGDMLRELVSTCLAFYIEARLDECESNVEPYRRQQSKRTTA